LSGAIAPPQGKGAIGVDLDGKTTVVVSSGTDISWGPAEALQPVYSFENGVDAKAARHLLRSRAAAPVNPRLNHEMGGDPQFVEHLCQWLSSQTHVRTLRMLTSLG